VHTTTGARAQFKDILRKTDSTIKADTKEQSTAEKQPAAKNQPASSTQSHQKGTNAPTAPEIESGIREAIQQTIKKSIAKVSSPDGFFKDASIKLLFPPEARKAEHTLRSLGLGSVCDKVILQMNRAAEDASKKAAPIFLKALKKMSIHDAAAIVGGGSDAATNYFKSNTSSELTRSFRPVIDSSLKKLQATTLYSQAVSKYNAFPLAGEKLNPSLSDYATSKAIDGLFTTIAGEEARLRSKSGLNSSPLVRKVFSYFNH